MPIDMSLFFCQPRGVKRNRDYSKVIFFPGSLLSSLSVQPLLSMFVLSGLRYPTCVYFICMMHGRDEDILVGKFKSTP